LRILVMAQGKIRERYFRDACDEYARRIARFLPVEVREVERLTAPPARHAVVALDARGRELDSAGFSAWLGRHLGSGRQGLAFLLGGADGIPFSTLSAAHERLSLSRLTLAHRLARVVLLEQIYRALTILRGGPYHR
jgi:23S rRNA (pseudouridine1915-N3)-methyltransferase